MLKWQVRRLSGYVLACTSGEWLRVANSNQNELGKDPEHVSGTRFNYLYRVGYVQ